MAPKEAPRKSLFGSQKWYFPDFPFRGSVGGRPVRKSKPALIRKKYQKDENRDLSAETGT